VDGELLRRAPVGRAGAGSFVVAMSESGPEGAKSKILILEAQLRVLEEAARLVIQIHQEREEQGYCRLCVERWPCATVAALEAVL
jgi:hypothetical protein